jgi:GNAT superfamily N-acetyltransferase
VTAGSASLPDAVTTSGHRIRPATAADLPVCAAIWRDSLNDYLGRLAQPEIPDDLVSILRLYDHLLATDPSTFLVAEAPAAGGEAARSSSRTAESPAIDAFAVVVRRDELSFLSMLFVRPTAQARGLGRALLAATGIDRPSDGDDTEAGAARRATATDTAQPISNGLYASLGIVPRIPLFRLVGLPARDDALEALPDGVEAIAFDEVGDAPDGLGRSALAAELDALDREAVGFSRQPDHSFQLREGRVGFLFRDREGRAVGYGYTSEAGRVGSVAVRDAALLGPIVGFLVRAVQPRGAFGLWVPGTAGGVIVPLLRAGFRFDGFPVLLCWDRPFADFSRYLPMSPGLL